MRTEIQWKYLKEGDAMGDVDRTIISEGILKKRDMRVWSEL
jgi:hypothetical protein